MVTSDEPVIVHENRGRGVIPDEQRHQTHFERTYIVNAIRHRQRDYMRMLVKKFGRNQIKVCSEYAKAERDGLVVRSSNSFGISPEAYAVALYRDGDRKGWFLTNTRRVQ